MAHFSGEEGHDHRGHRVTFEKFLIWLSGLGTEPATGWPATPTVAFNHDCRTACGCFPKTSTCALTMTLPVHFQDENDFTDKFSEAIISALGFGNM